MSTDHPPDYLQDVQRTIERFLAAFQFPEEGAAALAGELVEQLRPMFEDVSRAEAIPLLEALLHYSFDQSEEDIVAGEGIKAYLRRTRRLSPST